MASPYSLKPTTQLVAQRKTSDQFAPDGKTLLASWEASPGHGEVPVVISLHTELKLPPAPQLRPPPPASITNDIAFFGGWNINSFNRQYQPSPGGVSTGIYATPRQTGNVFYFQAEYGGPGETQTRIFDSGDWTIQLPPCRSAKVFFVHGPQGNNRHSFAASLRAGVHPAASPWATLSSLGLWDLDPAGADAAAVAEPLDLFLPLPAGAYEYTLSALPQTVNSVGAWSISNLQPSLFAEHLNSPEDRYRYQQLVTQQVFTGFGNAAFAGSDPLVPRIRWNALAPVPDPVVWAVKWVARVRF